MSGTAGVGVAAEPVEHEIEPCRRAPGELLLSRGDVFSPRRLVEHPRSALEVLKEGRDLLDVDVFPEAPLADAELQDLDDVLPSERAELFEAGRPRRQLGVIAAEKQGANEGTLVELGEPRERDDREQLVRRSPRIDELGRRGDPRAELAVHRLVEEVLLALAGEVNRPLRDPGVARDLVDRGLLEPEAREGLCGGDENTILLRALHGDDRSVRSSHSRVKPNPPLAIASVAY